MSYLKKSKNTKYDKKNGFVMIVALFVVLFVVAVGIAIVSIFVKEFQLTTLQRQSLKAFYAADTGVECAFHHDVAGIILPLQNVSIFPSPSTVDGSLGALPIQRKGGLEFPTTMKCGGDSETLPNLSTSDISNPILFPNETVYETRTDPPFVELSDTCVEIVVRKFLNTSTLLERTEISARGISTDRCNPIGKGVERALTLIWQTR